MLIAGFPCQTFSVIGRKEGFDDTRGQLIFHIARILQETQPKCFLLENVKGLVTHNKGATINIILNELNRVGYDVTYKVLTSLDYGVPQMRQRVYFIGFNKNLHLDINNYSWPEPIEKPELDNYLTDNHLVSEERLDILDHYLQNPTNNGKYTIDDLRLMDGVILDTRMNDLRIYTGKCPTLRSQRDGILYVRNKNIYQLTGYEALLLQGFPRAYADKVKNVVSDRHLLMQAGNAMTVNVITTLGKSIISFINNYGGNTIMNPGEDFEIRCFEYLRKMYRSKTTDFNRKGGMDSTTSDIAVIKNGHVDYYIEAKDSAAQSGQFVLLPDESSKTFIFSPRNHSEQNEMTEIIIDYMNHDFDRFNAAGTSGESLDIDSSVFSDWIINHYSERNVKYFISYKDNYVVFPIRRFASYFDVIANYRIKKSGSGHPAQKDIPSIKQLISKAYPSSVFTFDGKKLSVTITDSVMQNRFVSGKYTYYLSQKNAITYEIRRLSNTYNMNVIFSIQIKQGQNSSDLMEFEKDL